jgi:hypothetical protein
MIQQLNEQVISSEHATVDKPNINENLYNDPGIPKLGHRPSRLIMIELSEQQAAEESVEDTHVSETVVQIVVIVPPSYLKLTASIRFRTLKVSRIR